MASRKKISFYLILSLFTLLISILLSLSMPRFVEMLEAKTFDFRFILRGTREHGDDIAIVAIDDDSLEKFGRWPWSREKVAHLIEKISAAGARTIGVDILFTEKQVSHVSRTARALRALYGVETAETEPLLKQVESLSARNKRQRAARIVQKLKEKEEARAARERQFLMELDRLAGESAADETLARAIRGAGNVILAYAMKVPSTFDTFQPKPVPETLHDYRYQVVQEGAAQLPVIARGALIPIDGIRESAESLGHVYTQYDLDGAIRWEPLYVKLESYFYPVFGVEIARHFLGYTRDEVRLVTDEGLYLGEELIPADRSGRVLINYLGRTGSFPTYSAVDVMDGTLSPSLLEGRIVLIGATALGTSDTHITPYAQLPGIEKQAAVVENIINNSFLKREELLKMMEIAVLIVLTVILGFSLTRLRAKGGAVLSTLLFLGYLAITQYLFVTKGLWVSLLLPTFHIFFLYSTITAYQFLTEERRGKEIKTMFSSYVTERVVNELIKNPEMAKLGGHRSRVTVLFSDIRGFTAYSEKRKPEEVVTILNEYLTAMTEVIFRWDGTLDKFVGDEIMAFWGEPLKQPNHAELALRCSLHMMKRLGELQEKWKKEGLEPLDIGIGINTGDVLVGNIGAEGKKMDYTIIGDHVNLGARIEALTRDYNAHILITEFTYEEIRELVAPEKQATENAGSRPRIAHVKFRQIEPVKVKGKERPVMVYELEGNKNVRHRHVMSARGE